MELVSVSASSVTARMVAQLCERGVSAEDSHLVSKALVESSRRGIHSHGVNLFKHYIAALDAGRCRVRPNITIVPSTAAIARMDGDGGLGIVVASRATEQAISLARHGCGVGVVSVRNSNHFGAASVYSRQMAAAGLVGLVFSNADALVVPHNGSRPMFGTNPISVGAQGLAGETFCADFATSQGSFMKALAAFAAGEAPKAGYYVDSDGIDVVESGRDFAHLLPLGGHKGQCLGMSVTILSAVLAGGPFDHEMPNLVHAHESQGARTSHLFVALDPDQFCGRVEFAARLSALMGEVRRAGPEAVRVVNPGDLEKLAEQGIGADRVLVSAADAAYLRCQVRIDEPVAGA